MINSSDHQITSDRFILNKQHFINNIQLFPKIQSTQQTSYNLLIKNNLFNSQNIKNYNHTQQYHHYDINNNNNNYNNHNNILTQSTNQQYLQIQSSLNKNKNYNRFIHPIKVLDAINIRDDFYLNTLDWSDQGPLAVGLNKQVFIFTPNTLIELCKSSYQEYVSSIKFFKSIIGVGLSNGSVQFYDLDKNTLIRTLRNHKDRVSKINFIGNQFLSASKDRYIYLHDLRAKDSKSLAFEGHNGQICSLQPKQYSSPIFASGANDNTIIIWDYRKNTPINKLKSHKGAVKGLSWCPWKNGILASGGGNEDKSIKIWNTCTQNLLTTYKTNSQISGLLWNQNFNSLISSHGYNNNNISIWNFTQILSSSSIINFILKQEKSFQAHNNRILNMVQSGDHSTICTMSSDQTIKLWSTNQLSQIDPWNQKNLSSKKHQIINHRIL